MTIQMPVVSAAPVAPTTAVIGVKRTSQARSQRSDDGRSDRQQSGARESDDEEPAAPPEQVSMTAEEFLAELPEGSSAIHSDVEVQHGIDVYAARPPEQAEHVVDVRA